MRLMAWWDDTMEYGKKPWHPNESSGIYVYNLRILRIIYIYNTYIYIYNIYIYCIYNIYILSIELRFIIIFSAAFHFNYN
jgi:hypothetical protein